MLLHKVDSINNPFGGADYITELKLDGIRLLIVKAPSKDFRIFTRHGTDVTRRMPELHDFARSLPPDTVIDGEVILSDSSGAPDFEALMERFHITNSLKVASASVTHPLTYCPFDVIRVDGRPLTRLPLIDRKAELTSLLAVQPAHVAPVSYVEGNAEAYFNVVKERNLEGVVVKRAASPYYVNKRSKDWLKHVNYAQEDVLITGYRTAGDFGWLLAFEDGKPAGILELGVPAAARHTVYRAAIADEAKGIARLKEPIPCRVKYRNLTKAGYLRLPSFVTFL